MAALFMKIDSTSDGCITWVGFLSNLFMMHVDYSLLFSSENVQHLFHRNQTTVPGVCCFSQFHCLDLRIKI